MKKQLFTFSLLTLSLLLSSFASEDSKTSSKLFYYRESEKKSPAVLNFDIAVYGGTPAGVTAAIQAAKMGKKVVLLSFNRHVGGLTSGGLTATDIGNRKSIGGLAIEFYDRLGKIKNFSPAEAETLYLKMLREAGVKVLLNRQLKSAIIKNNKIEALKIMNGETINASVFIDSTYEGDLLAAANVSYYVGREPTSAYGESAAGQIPNAAGNYYQFCWLPISPFVNADDSNSGLLPEIKPLLKGKSGEGDFKVQAYNFRMYLSKSEDRIKFPKPLNYNKSRYALLSRFLNLDSRLKWTLNYTKKHLTDGPVQMREGDSNNAGSFSSDYIGGNYKWPDGTYLETTFSKLPSPRRGLPMPFDKLYKIRETIFQDHISYQQGLLYFLANDLSVPKELQERVNLFGLDPEEFKETNNWPHQLYVREGRRMLSTYVMTQANGSSTRKVEDSIGLASYPMDSHHCGRNVVIEKGEYTVRNEGNFFIKCLKPYPVSYRSIVPKVEECENLLVPLCLSSSHVCYGSIRMEPVFMILGQSAGTAASIAVDKKIPVQKVDYEELKTRLIKDKQRL